MITIITILVTTINIVIKGETKINHNKINNHNKKRTILLMNVNTTLINHNIVKNNELWYWQMLSMFSKELLYQQYQK
jgi:hypothetical protein